MVGLFVLAILVVLGIASALGYTVDTRDPEYGLGRVCEPRTAPDGESR